MHFHASCDIYSNCLATRPKVTVFLRMIDDAVEVKKRLNRSVITYPCDECFV